MLVSRSARVSSLSALESFARPRFALAVLPLLAALACKEAADPPRVFSISGLYPTDSVRLGKTHTFVTELRDASGNKVTGRQITWTSVNPTIAAVDANGVVTGVALGNTIITARVDDATATTQVLVQPAVTGVLVLPPTNTVAVGATRTLNVALTDKDGQTVAGRAVTFSTSNPAIATVNSSGTVTGIAVGNVTITGQSILDAVSGNASVSVVPVAVSSVAITPAGAQTVFQGLTLQLSATTRDNTGAILTGRPVNWTTSNPAIATVSSGGLVTGVGLGNAQITAESEGVTNSVSVTVSPRQVATVGLTPNPGTVKMGSALQMSLDLRDASGNQLTTVGRTVAWDSSNKPVATVSDGVVTGLSSGTATITVTVDGRSASAIVNVTP
jgi:uncharacterized protein YjdB